MDRINQLHSSDNSFEIQDRKPYSPPEIVYEFELEVHVGSPFNGPDPLNIPEE